MFDTTTEAEFVCACEEWMRSACASESFFREYQGRNYCVLHYPGQDKITAFNSAMQNKLELKDFNFCGVWFPEGVSFSRFQFSAPTDFSSATFNGGANFFKARFTSDGSFRVADVNFNSAIFSADVDFRFADFGIDADFAKTQYRAIADFSNAKFKAAAYFGGAKFGANAIFSYAKFGGDAFFFSANFSTATKFQDAAFSARADFSNATFSSDADFASATFKAEADFNHGTFASYVRFAGNNDHRVFGDHSYLDLQHARMERPERVSFHTLTLRPHWFVNADARKFEFVNVKLKPEILQDIKSLTGHLISAPHRLLDIAYRRLALNAEENHHYRDAADFRYAAMDVRRQEEWRGMAFWRLAWWYWLLSGYGERISRAAVCLLVIIVLFAGLYTQVGFVRPVEQTTKSVVLTIPPDTVGAPLRFTQALVHSFEVSILQKPDPKPLTLTARFLVGFETVLGPLQAALLALAIRRKFMR